LVAWKQSSWQKIRARKKWSWWSRWIRGYSNGIRINLRVLRERTSRSKLPFIQARGNTLTKCTAITIISSQYGWGGTAPISANPWKEKEEEEKEESRKCWRWIIENRRTIKTIRIINDKVTRVREIIERIRGFRTKRKITIRAHGKRISSSIDQRGLRNWS
jgi:hypothetical protein